MGAAVRKPAKSATKSAISRLQGELHPELWEGHGRPAPDGPAPAEAPQDRAPSQARAGRARGGSAAAGGARGDDGDDSDDGYDGDDGGVLAGLDYASLAAGYASSSDEEVDVGSDAKVARVRKLMELPVAEAAAGRRVPDRQIRAMLADAHGRCQGIDMLDFVHECKRRLEEEDDLERSSAGRRCSHLLTTPLVLRLGP